jgi:hypothetical protein
MSLEGTQSFRSGLFSMTVCVVIKEVQVHLKFFKYEKKYLDELVKNVGSTIAQGSQDHSQTNHIHQ